MCSLVKTALLWAIGYAGLSSLPVFFLNLDGWTHCAAIGVTENIDHNQLLAFASDPRYVFEIKSFMELGSETQMVQTALLAFCGRANFTLTVPPFTGKPLYTGRQRRTFVPYLCQLNSAAILWLKLFRSIVTLMSRKYALSVD